MRFRAVVGIAAQFSNQGAAPLVPAYQLVAPPPRADYFPLRAGRVRLTRPTGGDPWRSDTLSLEGMRMRWLLVLVLGLSWPMAPALATPQKPPRNVVLIIADDLGLDPRCYGNKAIRTPNLDGLAKKGMVFTRAYATVASCSPSRASILTGMFTHQNGQYGLQHQPHSQQTYPWVQSLANLLRTGGYWTGLIGKFHVGPDSVYNFHRVITKGTGGNRDVAAMARLAREFIGQSEKRPF